MEEDNQNFHITQMQKNQIIQELKLRNCRITKQRLMLLDIILKEDCSCCKEIYYQALKMDHNIGKATVYRMINTLEDIGALSRKNMYKITCCKDCGNKACDKEHVCTVELDDETVFHLSAHKWKQVIAQGLKQCGYLSDQQVKRIEMEPQSCS